MAEMDAFVKQIEKQQRHAVPRDGWGNAMQINIAGSHYSVRAAAADGEFESGHPRTPTATEGFAADILIVDGRYVQFPSGICAGDEPGKGPLGNCASCHPHHIAKAIGSPGHGTREAQHSHR